jgi:hypothetical protein
MANDRNRTDDVDYTGPNRDSERDMSEDRGRSDAGDEIRGIADEGDEEFEDSDDLENEDDSDVGSL